MDSNGDRTPGHRRVFTLLLIAPATILVLGLVWVAWVLASHLAPPYEPLYFPGQHVATPVVHIGGDVTVSATRCNKSKKPVTYHALKSWQSIDPAGSIIVVGTSVATEQPGCTHFTFKNPMPPLVVSRTQGLLSTGLKSVTWEITAVDTPEGHANAKSVSWATTPIKVVP